MVWFVWKTKHYMKLFAFWIFFILDLVSYVLNLDRIIFGVNFDRGFHTSHYNVIWKVLNELF